MNGLALCAGFGGIEQGLESILPDYSTVCYVEGEAYPVAVLIEKMEKGRIHPAPIWSNLRTFEGTRWRGSVDIITGGFPCQPHSNAGKLRGKDDPRNLWPDVVRIISEVRPNIIFMENVANINNTYGSEIIGDLAKMGFDAAWCVVRASDVGAPHRRARWFLLAYPHDSAEYVMSVYGSFTSPQEYEKNVCHSDSDGFEKHTKHENGGEGVPQERKLEGNRLKEISHSNPKSNGGVIQSWKSWVEGDLSNSNSEGVQGGIFGKGANIESRHKPNEVFIGESCSRRGHKSTHWEVEPRLARLVDGVANWTHRVRGAGNGVVPQQAAYAFQILAERLACGIDANLDPKGC